ncbi:MAG: hypothetical protein ACUVUS_10170, partial [Thermoproteota archaeon]
EVLEKFFPEKIKGKYTATYKDYEGKIKSKTLEEVIEHHHYSDAFWERLWAFSDKLSTVAGRFRLDYDYWHYDVHLNPFIVRVYGDIKEWTVGERGELCRKIINILEQYCDREAERVKAFEEVNRLLAEFPADSRFPYTSLRTHHWLTEVIRGNDAFWLKCVRGGKNAVFDRMYIVRMSIAESEFHRLKEIRSFIELRSKILDIASRGLSKWNPIQIGDDLYVICLSEGEVKEVINSLIGTGFGYDLAIFTWDIGREEKRVDPDEPDKGTLIYVLKDVKLTRLSVGVHEEFEYTPESSAEYSKILEGEYEYVAWISITPKGDMRELAEEFLKWGENELSRRYGDKRKRLPESIREPERSPFLSPELALSMAEGYDEFLMDCAREINAEKPDESIAAKSFSRTVFVCGLNNPSEAFQLYNKLAEAKTKLHIPAILSAIMTKPKYPFWRVLELFKSDVDCLVFVVGERTVKLTDEVVGLLRQITHPLKGTSRSQYAEIIRFSRRAGLEELKFRIEGKAADNKIPFEASKRLCWLINELSKRYKDDELRAVIWRCLKVLEPYTRK